MKRSKFTFIQIFCCVNLISLVGSTENNTNLADLYDICQSDSNRYQVCYSYSSLNDEDCLKSLDCDYLVIAKGSRVPTSFMAANKTPYENNQEQQLTIKTYILQSAASTQDFWLTDGKTAYLYRCEVTDSKSSSLVENNPIRRWKSIKKAYLVPQIQDGSAIMGCSWLISQYNTDWPLNENGKPVDLINNPYSLVFGSIDGVYSNKHVAKSLIPIYQLQYLYEECKQKSKICYGSNDCVKSASCSELLIITTREYDAIYIDFMFLILVPQEQTSYVIDIKPLPRILKDGNGQNETMLHRLILRTYCDQNICRHKAVFHDFLEIVLDENVLTYSSSHVTGSVRKFIWSLPMIFELNGTLFNCKDTMYKVAMKSSDGLVLAESKSSGLPGYSLREDVFKECTMIKLSSDERGSSAVCYGFNKNDPTSGCLKCSSCSVVAILKPLLTTISNENAVEREELELQLYAQEETTSFGLFFDYSPDLELSFGYQCLNGEKDGRDDQLVTESTTSDESYGQVVNQNGLVAYGSVFCKFIISEDLGTWPLMKNGEMVDLIKEPISVKLTWNHYQKIVDPDGSHNPIFRFRYLYESCLRKSSNVLCIGFDGCLDYQNCTNLVVISYRNSSNLTSLSLSSTTNNVTKPFQDEKLYGSHGLLDWAVYAADDSDSFVVSFSGDNVYGDDYAILCTPSGFSEHYIWETGKLKSIQETVIHNTKRQERLNTSGFRCFWTMPGRFSVFFSNFQFDVATDNVHMNLTFQKNRQRQHSVKVITTLPGYKSKNNGSSRMQHQLLPLIVTFLVFLLS